MDKKTVSLLKKAMRQTIKINALERELIKGDEKINLAKYYDTRDWQKAILHYAISLYKGLDSISKPIQFYTPDLNSFIRRECAHMEGSKTLILGDFVHYASCRRASYDARFWRELEKIIEDIWRGTEI